MRIRRGVFCPDCMRVFHSDTNTHYAGIVTRSVRKRPNQKDMIEVFDARRTRSFGCFASFKSAEDTLDSLARDGVLGEVPGVSVSAYRNNVLQREYPAVFVGGKWRMPKARKRAVTVPLPASKKRKRKLCKEYLTAELMFREAFPDHLNKTYPLSADTLKICSRRCRVYA